MERISGIVEQNSSDDREVGRYILQSFDTKETFVLLNDGGDFEQYLRRPVQAEGYRARTWVGTDKIALKVVEMTGLRDGLECEGMLKRLIMTPWQYGTHGVYDNKGKILYALESQTLDLDIYAGRTVIATGYPMVGYPIDGGPSLLSVTDVHLPVRSRPGEKFDIRLEANYTTGYTWKLEDVEDPSVVELINEDYVVDNPDRIGAGGTAIFTFLAKHRGRTSLTLLYSQGWRLPKAASRIKFMAMVE